MRLPRNLRVSSIGLAIGIFGLSVAFGSSASAAGVPYTDGKSSGAIGFCDASGHEVRSGRITDAPMAAFAVSNYRPPAPYDRPNTGAWLLALQPRQGNDPGEWSGEQMTATSTYTNPNFPKAEVLATDITLEQVVHDFPPKWDGLVQLRMYVKTADDPTYLLHYPTADIKISGNTWTMVRGGGVTCTGSGTASSIIHGIILPQSAQESSAATGSSASSGAPKGSSGGKPSSDNVTTSASHKSNDVGRSWLLPTVAMGVLLLVGGAIAGRKRLFGRWFDSPT